MGDTDPSDVNAFSKKPKEGRHVGFPRGADSRVKVCDFCGRIHDVSKRENCPAFGFGLARRGGFPRGSVSVVSIIWRMNFQTKCSAYRRFQR